MLCGTCMFSSGLFGSCGFWGVDSVDQLFRFILWVLEYIRKVQKSVVKITDLPTAADF